MPAGFIGFKSVQLLVANCNPQMPALSNGNAPTCKQIRNGFPDRYQAAAFIFWGTWTVAWLAWHILAGYHKADFPMKLLKVDHD